MKEDFLISVIMPLYNVEAYFEEAIESVINQTIGFEDNIQIILVNDGSPDDIESLGLKYQEKYPENILYLKQSNGGVSSARNFGMQYVKGKYINFFDADDKWDEDAYRQAYEFLIANSNEINVVACRYYFFGKREGFIHPLDEKYSGERIIDISKEPQSIHMAVNSLMIRTSAISELRFDTRLKVAEDTIFATKLICKKGKYGVVPTAIYNYRKRMNNNSAIDMTTSSRSWYFDTPEYCLKELFRYSQEHFGEIIPYIQYIVMYDIRWRLEPQMPDDFTAGEREIYKKHLVDLVKKIDDQIIWEQALNPFYKIFVLELKYDEKVLECAKVEKSWLIYRDLKVFNLRGNNFFRINILDIKGDEMSLVGGTTLSHLGELCELIVRDNDNNDYPIEVYDIGHGNRFVFTGETLIRKTGFRVTLPISYNKAFSFIAKIAGTEIMLKPFFKAYARLNHKLPHTYYVHDNYLIKYEKNRIKCFKNRRKTHIISELRYMRDLLSSKKVGIIFYRLAFYLLKHMSQSPIWLISDRTNLAGDNGEALFRYVNEKCSGKIKAYFFIYKNTQDFNKMKQVGKVLALDSLRYKLKFLLADKIISSHIDEWVIGAFDQDKKYVKDLFKYDFVFLQHGVIQSDLSSWLYKQKKNIKLFVTSSPDERDSILLGNYGYTEKEVKLLGLPRHDYLTSEREKKIIFLPTWRQNISLPTTERKGERPYSEYFKYTEYFLFYNRLINDPRLISEMKKAGYTGEFYVHPSFSEQYRDFVGNEVITVGNQIADYNSVFKIADLLVTDYSSVAFDFSLLKKPVIYTQFDYDMFYQSHISESGYFSYKEDGFGPVFYDYDSALEGIINQIKNGCQMEEKYKQRVDHFFAYNDHNNCQRVYQAILDINEG